MQTFRMTAPEYTGSFAIGTQILSVRCQGQNNDGYCICIERVTLAGADFDLARVIAFGNSLTKFQRAS